MHKSMGIAVVQTVVAAQVVTNLKFQCSSFVSIAGLTTDSATAALLHRTLPPLLCLAAGALAAALIATLSATGVCVKAVAVGIQQLPQWPPVRGYEAHGCARWHGGPVGRGERLRPD